MTLAQAIHKAIKDQRHIVYRAWFNKAVFDSEDGYSVASTLPKLGIRVGNVIDGEFVPNPEYDAEVARINAYFTDNRYYIEFTAREAGALGVQDTYYRAVDADTQENAIVKLYSKFDHIHVVRIRDYPELGQKYLLHI